VLPYCNTLVRCHCAWSCTGWMKSPSHRRNRHWLPNSSGSLQLSPYLQHQQKHRDFQAGSVCMAMISQAGEHHSGRLSLENSHQIAGCSALQSLPSQPSHIKLQLDSVQKQGAVPLREKARKKSNYDHQNAFNLWPTDLPVLSNEWKNSLSVCKPGCAAHTHRVHSFTGSTSTAFNSSKQSDGKHIRDFSLSFSHEIARKQ